ncbi:hypothetical protein ACFT30_11005 [Microbacterium ureisolvens]|uniref:hypothetical protein n=1 Tax=Microbacterium ureisolvens TaxID=2781186 RepID=UPI00363E4DED
MLTPRSRKPVDIPSLPPVDHTPAARAVRAPRASASARLLARAGELFRPRAGRRITHRRLVDKRSGIPDRAGGDGADASTFRGATARFVALG